ncbi:hypothetical protein CEXT_43991 [Caerostris extrusa]|uniref:Uncharacterized protein n=1 Tax=Caerostris extrusa TaxID=172846 RepID=A0AAV4NDA9_CAEEX|nr:hypothetical protein CEXT_43991 [Caerostris extrusa]
MAPFIGPVAVFIRAWEARKLSRLAKSNYFPSPFAAPFSLPKPLLSRHGASWRGENDCNSPGNRAIKGWGNGPPSAFKDGTTRLSFTAVIWLSVSRATFRHLFLTKEWGMSGLL